MINFIFFLLLNCANLDNHLVIKNQDLGKIQWVDNQCFTSVEFINPTTPAFWGYIDGEDWFIINEKSVTNGLPLIISTGDSTAPECFKNLTEKYR